MAECGATSGPQKYFYGFCCASHAYVTDAALRDIVKAVIGKWKKLKLLRKERHNDSNPRLRLWQFQHRLKKEINRN
jgi:hypothetical protein